MAQTFGSATAAKPITRETADKVLSQLLERVDRVNRDEHFLAKITKVVLLGSYLRPEIDRLSDVDVAVELQPKERNWDRLREATQERVETLRTTGHRFRNWLEAEYWWHVEAFRFLKGQSRGISLIDYKAEQASVDKVPHKVLFSSVNRGRWWRAEPKIGASCPGGAVNLVTARSEIGGDAASTVVEQVVESIIGSSEHLPIIGHQAEPKQTSSTRDSDVISDRSRLYGQVRNLGLTLVSRADPCLTAPVARFYIGHPASMLGL